MEDKKLVSVTVPPKGRTFNKAIKELYERGFVEECISDRLIEVLDADAKEVKSGRFRGKDEMIDIRDQYRDEEIYSMINITPNSERPGSPYRLVFNTLDIESAKDLLGSDYADTAIRLVGMDHIHAPSYLVSHSAEIGIVGYDEILLALSSQMGKNIKRKIKKWPGFNKMVENGNSNQVTDMRIKGSMGLDDYTIHVMVENGKVADNLANSKFEYTGADLLDAGRVFVDEKYENLYKNVHRKKRGACFAVSNKVEDDVRENMGRGIVIMNSGRTVKDRDLQVIGPPMLVSETVIAYDREKSDYKINPRNAREVCAVMEALQPHTYTNKERLDGFSDWYENLKENVEDIWKPEFPRIRIFYANRSDRRSWVKGYGREKINNGSKYLRIGSYPGMLFGEGL